MRKQPVMDRIKNKTLIQDDGCWVWQGPVNNVGYGLIRADTNGKKTMRSVHRVVAENAGMDIEGKCVMHSCRNHACVNPAHLLTGTIQDVYVAREADPKNSRFGRKLGEKAPTKQCPHCDRQIAINVMYRHLSCTHKTINK